MANIETLISVAGLLPEAQRERFLAMAASFQSVPEDDEFLMILEAIGFMTLLWKRVPGEVAAVLEGANPVTETCDSVAAKVREAVIESIPSYDDLKTISQRLESHELALKNTLSRLSPPPAHGFASRVIWVLLAFFVGLVLGGGVIDFSNWRSWIGF